MCGENSTSAASSATRSGSSPRVRGKPLDREPLVPSGRLIPACAGKTSSCGASCCPWAAHPRVCGENRHTNAESRSDGGSSPRVRGKPHHGLRVRLPVGLIPACAGKTGGGLGGAGPHGAHPRVCGENTLVESGSTLRRGSSPRVRGKLGLTQTKVSARRLIPACAGKTSRSRGSACPGSAHPRVCGENDRAAPLDDEGKGSSPRVRGKPPRHPVGGAHPRLIPACAGKTWNGWGTALKPAAHPRVCGENLLDGDPPPPTTGSSPRVRGKRPPGPVALTVAGLIPACAGKTRRRRWSGRPRRAHPRVCGENVFAVDVGRAPGGSSPRVRGKHLAGSTQNLIGRLIPACAGKTVGVLTSPPWRRAHPRVCGENIFDLTPGGRA